MNYLANYLSTLKAHRLVFVNEVVVAEPYFPFHYETFVTVFIGKNKLIMSFYYSRFVLVIMSAHLKGYIDNSLVDLLTMLNILIITIIM